MSEHMRAFGDYFKRKPGYEGYLDWRVATIPDMLQDAGYFTVLSGKWLVLSSIYPTYMGDILSLVDH